jgi:hypothetical protein
MLRILAEDEVRIRREGRVDPTFRFALASRG